MRTNLSKDPKALLLLIFCISVTVKALVSLKFQGPYIFLDEVAYAKIAENFFSSQGSSLPQFYPFILSIAYIFSREQSVAYHIILFLNCILSALAVFPSYIILNKYCSRNYSLISSLAIVTLPSMTIYNFAIMAENLFISLFIFSLWFLIEAYEKKRPVWIALAISSVLLIFLTKRTGVFMVLGLLASFVHYEIGGISIKDGISKINKAEIAFSMGLLILSAVATYVILNTKSNLYHFMIGEIFLFNMYIPRVLSIFSDVSSLISFLSLFAHEIEYLIMTTYFATFVIMALFIIILFYKSHSKEIPSSSWFDLSCLKGDRALKSSFIYLLVSGFILVFVIAANMYISVSRLPEGYDYILMTNRADMELLGRYVDPLVPAIFLFGLIGLDRMRLAREDSKLKIISAIAAVFILLSLIFAVSFPYYASKGPDILTINYTKYLATIIPLWAIAPLVSAIFFLCLYLRIIDNRFKYLFLVSIILFSIITTASTVERTTLPASTFFTSQNSIGIYLEMHSNDSSIVLMDNEDDRRDPIMMSLTKFWTHAKFATRSTPEDPSGVYTDYARTRSYIISSKILPYEQVAYSSRGYLLYKPTKIKDCRSLYGFDMISGWHDMELWNGLPTSWMKGQANLTVYSDRDLPATLSFDMLSFHTKRELKIYYQDNLITLEDVPTNFVKVNLPIDLKYGANRVYLYAPEGCIRPVDIPALNIPDDRCVSFAVQNLSISQRIGNTSLPLVN